MIDRLLLFGQASERHPLLLGVRAICYRRAEPDHATRADEDPCGILTPLGAAGNFIVESDLVDEA